MNPDLAGAVSGLVVALDYASALGFALTGALMASRLRLDLTGFVFMGIMTAVGGGTVRDLILGRAVFWVTRPELVLLAAAASCVVFWTAHLLERRPRPLRWLDAMSLSVAVPAGVGAALADGFDPVIVVIAGILTGCFGGMMRDVFGNGVPLVLERGELYLTAAFGGTLVALAAVWLGLPRPAALAGCGLGTFLLRTGALLWGWSLPVYRTRD